MATPRAPGALEGTVVVDFSRVLAGPLATMMLGDLGADVIKVEEPHVGDATRGWGPPWQGRESTYFLSVNRNKRSITLDLRDPADAAVARRLVDRADVLVENFRPATMERYGLDYERVRQSNPGLVYCSISAFGEGGGAALPGYDFLLQAVGGLMSITGEARGAPVKTGVAVIDVVCGLHAVTGVLAALGARSRSQRGQRLTVSLMASSLAALVNQASAFLNAGVVPERMGNLHPSIVPYQTFDAADRPIALAVGSDALWARLCTAIGRDDLLADPRFTTNSRRVNNAQELTDVLSGALSTRPGREWVDLLQANGVPAGLVNDVGEAFAMASALGLDPIVEVVDASGVTTRTPRSPVELSDSPVTVRLPPPSLGQHSKEIRAWLDQPV